jgi:hypothetical protein
VIGVTASHLTTPARPKAYSVKAFASKSSFGWPIQIAATIVVIAAAGRCCFNHDSHDDYQKQYFHLYQSNQIHSIFTKIVVGKNKF